MLALAGGTIFTDPSADPIRDGVVLIDGKTIAAAGSRDTVDAATAQTVIDCTGMTVTAGFWNCHVHFFERKWSNASDIPGAELAEQLADFTRFGFTSVFDLGSRWENTRTIRDRVASGEVDGPEIYSTGEIIIPPGAMPAEAVLRALGTTPVPPHEAADALQAADAADAILTQGVDALKVFASGNAPEQRLTADVLRAAVERAHGSNKPVFAHTNDAQDVLNALAAGVDVIAHTTPRSGAWNAEIIATAQRNDAALTPTLGVWPHLMRHDRVSLVRSLRETAVSQLRMWNDQGAAVLFGTDLGAVDPDPSTEFALMREAGMTFPQILASLTTQPAKRFAPSRKCGRIAPGFEADLTVFATPFDVRCTVRAGRVLYEAA